MEKAAFGAGCWGGRGCLPENPWGVIDRRWVLWGAFQEGDCHGNHARGRVLSSRIVSSMLLREERRVRMSARWATINQMKSLSTGPNQPDSW